VRSPLQDVVDARDDLSGATQVLTVGPGLVDLVPAVEDVSDGAGGHLGLGGLESPRPETDRGISTVATRQN